MTQKTKIISWICGLVVLVIIIVAATYYATKLHNKNSAMQNSTGQTPQTAKYVNAPAGQLVEGFPQSAAQPGNTVVNSFQSQYPNSTSYTTQFNSSKSVSEEYGYYQNYLKSQKYEISSEKLTDSMGSMFALSQDQKKDVNVTIFKTSSGSQIDVIFTN